MMKSKVTGRIIVVLVMTIAFALLAAPAWATTSVPHHVVLAGPGGKTTDLYGLDAVSAPAAIASVTPEPRLSKLTLKANGRTLGPFTFKTSSVVWVDKPAILAKALAATTDCTITPLYAVNGTTINAWVVNLNKLAYTKPVNSVLKVANRKVIIVAAKNGYAVNRAATAQLIAARLRERAAAWPQVTDAGTVWASLGTFKPTRVASYYAKVKTIVVVLPTHWLTLYTGDKITVRFRCANGQPKYPTPVGVWTVYRKAMNPVWHNPHDIWSAGMPETMSGSSSPLGLRALYLKTSPGGVDLGIRIHGTKNIASIGTPASHGCIRLANANVVKLYPLVPIGTKVYTVK
jgi:lipoprotein-anchoring transpeptidase ErfK/SrfK